jgi:hypothetical protein
MTEQQSSRRNFLKVLGLSASAPLVGASAFAAFNDHPKIRELNPDQLEFMNRYGKWMDEFLELAHKKKKNPDSLAIGSKMMELSEKAEAFKPELAEHMKDETFALIFKVTVEQIGKETL